MSKAEQYLSHSFSGLDSDSIEYIISIARDDSLESEEKVSLITDFISGAVDFSGDPSDTAISVINLAQIDIEEEKKMNKSIEVITSEAVIECLSVIKAPVVHTQRDDTPANDAEEVARRRQLLKMYDPDSEVQQRNPCHKTDNVDDEEEIYGLGANENRLRKLREREEERAQAKKEQEEARQIKVQEKLKKQGQSIKGKTVVRTGKRS